MLERESGRRGQARARPGWRDSGVEDQAPVSSRSGEAVQPLNPREEKVCVVSLNFVKAPPLCSPVQPAKTNLSSLH